MKTCSSCGQGLPETTEAPRPFQIEELYPLNGGSGAWLPIRSFTTKAEARAELHKMRKRHNAAEAERAAQMDVRTAYVPQSPKWRLIEEIES